MSREPRSCRAATRLISAALDRPLSARERLALRCHLLVCTACRRFGRQIREVRAFMAGLPADALPSSFVTDALSEEALARLAHAVREAAREP